MESPEGKLVCLCMSVYDSEIIAAIENHDVASVADVSRYTAAGTGCGRCKSGIQAILETQQHKRNPGEADPPLLISSAK
ncbi:MAG: (2Fe-2S)-binding protein [Bacteroidales bacterium]